MKTLVLNGSPRKNGYTAAMVRELARSLHGDVAEIETYRAGVSPCTDCRWCWQHPACSIDDAMQAHYKQIDEADNIVIASPIYFYELTGSLLSWASRLQMLYTAKAMRGTPILQSKLRKGGVLLADGGNGKWETALAMGNRLLRVMDAVPAGHAYVTGTDKAPMPPVLDDAASMAIERLASALNER